MHPGNRGYNAGGHAVNSDVPWGHRRQKRPSRVREVRMNAPVTTAFIPTRFALVSESRFGGTCFSLSNRRRAKLANAGLPPSDKLKHVLPRAWVLVDLGREVGRPVGAATPGEAVGRTWGAAARNNSRWNIPFRAAPSRRRRYLATDRSVTAECERKQWRRDRAPPH